MIYDVNTNYGVFFRLWAGDGQLAAFALDVSGSDLQFQGNPRAYVYGRVGDGAALEGKLFNIDGTAVRTNPSSEKASVSIELYQMLDPADASTRFAQQIFRLLRARFRDGEETVRFSQSISLV